MKCSKKGATMIDEFEKKEITICVHPYTAAATIGLMRGFLPALIGQMEKMDRLTGLKISDIHLYPNMKEVLDEIYEQCVVHTDIRENAAKLAEIFEMTGGVWPDGKES